MTRPCPATLTLARTTLFNCDQHFCASLHHNRPIRSTAACRNQTLLALACAFFAEHAPRVFAPHGPQDAPQGQESNKEALPLRPSVTSFLATGSMCGVRSMHSRLPDSSAVYVAGSCSLPPD